MWKSHLEYSAKLRQNIIHSTVYLDVALFQQNIEFSKHNHMVTTIKVFQSALVPLSNKLLTERIKKFPTQQEDSNTVYQTCKGAILEHISVKLTMSLKNIVTLLKNSAGICCLFLSFSATGNGNIW